VALRICLLLISLALIAPATYAQTIFNTGFEDGATPWSFRQGWARDCTTSKTGRCSAHYQHRGDTRTPITTQRFRIDRGGFCQLTVWLRTELEDPPFWSDGEPTRTGLSVQLWNRTGTGPRVPLDLARKHVYTKGYRGQAGTQGWTKYVGRLSMAAGPWEVRLYMHPVRTRIQGRITKLTNAKGHAWVDDVELIRLDD
jgi:hypothetical protein